MKDILVAACRARPSDPLAQVAMYLDHASRRGIPAGTGKRRQVGEKRLTEIGNALKLAVASCREARTPIQNLSDLGQSHVIALVRLWNDKHHLVSGTIADRVSVLRRFFVMVGRPDVIPMGEAWREMLRRHGIALPIRSNMAQLAKGWRDMGVEPYAVFEEMEAAGYWVVSSQSKMMLEWGLRRKESAMLRPHDSDKGTYLLVSRGTKGGKTREVKLSAEPERRARQLAALQQAKALADKHPRGELALPGKELQTMLEHQRFVFEKFGIVGSMENGGLGVVPHGLRHQFGCDLFEELTGWPAPVLGKLPAAFYRQRVAEVKKAMLEVSRQMGHERPQISGAYLSTPSTMGRQQRIRLAATLEALQLQRAIFLDAGIDAIWITGRAASGLPQVDVEPLSMLVRVRDMHIPLTVLKERMAKLAFSLQGALQRLVVVGPWLDEGTPPEAAEVMYAPE